MEKVGEADPDSRSGGPLLQFARAGTTVRRLPAEIRRRRREFERSHAFILPSALEPALLAYVQARVRGGRFLPRLHPSGKEMCMVPEASVGVLNFMLNEDAVLRAIERLTGCGPLRGFRGRVYRLDPNAGHFHGWHRDFDRNRLLGVSINLTEGAYDGGLLQLRRMRTREVIYGAANRGAGDMLVFRIDASLQHRVTPVSGDVPKVSFAGWFLSKPPFRRRLAAV